MAELGRVEGLTSALSGLTNVVSGLTSAMSDRSRRTAGQVLIVVALAVGCWTFLAQTAARHGYFDLRVYFGAINFWIQDGGQIYDYLLPKTGYGFTYPPFAALMMAPMAFVSWHTAIGISLVLSAVSMAAMIYWLVGPIAERRGWPRWFAFAIAFELAAVFEPIRETVNFGQVNMILLVVAAADMLLLVRKGHPLGGIGVGLATAIKLTPGVFIIYLLVTRRWKAAAVASGSAAAATWLAATIAPDASRVFWTDALWNTDRVGSTAFISNQSLKGFVSRLNPVEPSTFLWAALLLAAFAIWMVRVRRAVDAADETTAFALTGIFSCMISPITWVHHLVWVFPALVLLLDNALDGSRSPRSRRGLLFGAIVGYALLSSRVIWAFEYQYDGLGVIGSNVYIFILCALLIGLPVRTRIAAEAAVASGGRPTAEDVPDLVELDRRVTAAFDAREAGLPVTREAAPLVEAGVS